MLLSRNRVNLTTVVYVKGYVACDSIFTPTAPKYPTPKAIKYIDGKTELICATAGLHPISAYIQDYMDYNYGFFEEIIAKNPSTIIKELDISIRNCLELLTNANSDFYEHNSENVLVALMLILNGKPLLFYFDKVQMNCVSIVIHFLA
jgi:hypothetical protein